MVNLYLLGLFTYTCLVYSLEDEAEVVPLLWYMWCCLMPLLKPVLSLLPFRFSYGLVDKYQQSELLHASPCT